MQAMQPIPGPILPEKFTSFDMPLRMEVEHCNQGLLLHSYSLICRRCKAKFTISTIQFRRRHHRYLSHLEFYIFVSPARLESSLGPLSPEIPDSLCMKVAEGWL